MPTDMTARQLIKQVPHVIAALEFVGTDTIVIDAENSGEGWQVVDNGKLYLVWRGYIDLAGYTQNDLTFFSQAIDIQHGALDLAGPTVLNTCHIDLITTRRLRDSECHLYAAGFLGPLPTSGEALDIQEVVYGEWANYVPYASAYPALRQIGGDSFGTGNPTASERLHITRILATEGTGSEGVVFNATNYLIGGVTAHEKDLVYIERLRRAYTQERN